MVQQAYRTVSSPIENIGLSTRIRNTEGHKSATVRITCHDSESVIPWVTSTVMNNFTPSLMQYCST